jgi:hypothetical protein
MTATIERRSTAAQKTKDRFEGEPWKPGKFDCWQMAAFHARAVGNPLKIASKIGVYHSVAGGIRKLRRLGHKDIPSALDAAFERITPAAAIVGDFIQMLSEDDDIGGVTVCLGNGRVIGYHEEAIGACVLQPLEMVAAWRAV